MLTEQADQIEWSLSVILIYIFIINFIRYFCCPVNWQQHYMIFINRESFSPYPFCILTDFNDWLSLLVILISGLSQKAAITHFWYVWKVVKEEVDGRSKRKELTFPGQLLFSLLFTILIGQGISYMSNLHMGSS